MKKTATPWLIIGALVVVALAPFVTGNIISESYKVRDARNRVNSCLDEKINAGRPGSRKIDVAAFNCLANGYCSVVVSTRNERSEEVRATIDPKTEKVFLDKNSKPIALESESALDVFGNDVERIDDGISACFGHSLKELIRRHLREHFE